MNVNFKSIEPLTQVNAEIIADQWHYSDEYSVYDINYDQAYYDEFIAKEQRADNYFQVLNDQGGLTAFFSIKPGNNGYAEIDLGMNPNLIGHGYGLRLIQLIENYVKNSTDFGGMVLSVATFNQRAIKVFKRSGFEVIILGQAQAVDGPYEFFKLFKKIEK